MSAEFQLIYLIYGAAFFVMGVTVLVRIAPIWEHGMAGSFIWLGLFALLHGFSEWSGLPFVRDVVLLSSPFPAIVLAGISYCALLQFGLTLHPTTRSNRHAVRLTVPALILSSIIVFVFLDDAPSHELATRYLFGVPATFVAALAVFQSRHGLSSDQLNVAWPVLMAAGLLSYSVLTSVSGPGGALPALVWDQAEFEAIFGIPVQVARTFTAFLITVAVYKTLALFDVLEKQSLAEAVGRATRSLRESEARFRDFAETASDWLWETDAEDRIIFTTDSYYQSTGLRPEDVIGVKRRKIFDGYYGNVTSTEDGDKDAHFSSFDRREAFHDLLVEFQRPDGAMLYFLSHGRPVHGEGGEFRGYRGTAVDVTERRRAERSLIGSERLLRSFIDNSDAIMTLKDTAGRYLLVNEQFKRLRGAGGDIFGKTFYQYGDKADADIVAAAESRIIETGKVQLLDGLATLPDGTVYHRRSTKFPVYDAEGGLTGVGTISIDISEQKRAEESLRASEARFSGILGIAPEAVISVDEDRRIRIFNRGAEKIFGYDAVEAMGQPLTMLLPERFREKHNTQLSAFAGSGEVSRLMNQRGVVAGLRKDGTEFPAEASISRLTIGEETIFTVMLHDITDRKRAEDALRESEQRLVDAVQSLPLGFVLYDADECLVLWNDIAAEYLPWFQTTRIKGMRYSDMLRNATAEGWIPEAAGQEDEWIAERVEQFRNPMPEGREILLKNGRTMFVAERKTSDGGTVAIRMDITDRIRTQDALKESEGRFRAVVDNSPAAISLKDANGRFLVMNRKYRDWQNIGGMDYLGKTIHDFMQKDAADAIAAHDTLVMEAGVLNAQERTITFPDGVTRTIWAQKFPITGPEGECAGVGTATLDVTDQRNTENQLIQAQKMEAVGQLTGGIAHDFNNLLGVVIGNLDFLTEELQDNADLLALADAATKAALNGAALNRQLLAFSRKQTLSPEVIDLNEHVSDMYDILRRTLGASIEIEAKLSDGLWPADVDPAQVESALLNLAVNARDAMPVGGKLTIETANVSLDDNFAAAQMDVAPGDYAMLALTDTGAGMTPEILAHVFEPFFTTKDVGEGSGLGLSMVFGFAKQSGGHVTIYSEVGKGTTVKLYLPRVRRAVNSAKEEAVQFPMAEGETVLVVEDDPNLRTLVVAMLDDLGYDILEAGNGESALAAMVANPRINLLLSDVVLPGGMGGPDIAAAAEALLPDVKVLFMSGYPRDAVTRQGRLDDGVLLLEKPFRKIEFARKIREALAAAC